MSAAVLVVRTGVATDEEGRVFRAFAAVIWAGFALSLKLFFSAITVLYSAYPRMNHGDSELDGSCSNRAFIAELFVSAGGLALRHSRDGVEWAFTFQLVR